MCQFEVDFEAASFGGFTCSSTAAVVPLPYRESTPRPAPLGHATQPTRFFAPAPVCQAAGFCRAPRTASAVSGTEIDGVIGATFSQWADPIARRLRFRYRASRRSAERTGGFAVSLLAAMDAWGLSAWPTVEHPCVQAWIGAAAPNATSRVAASTLRVRKWAATMVLATAAELGAPVPISPAVPPRRPSDDVAVVVELWSQRGLSDSDRVELDPLLPKIQAWVLESEPSTPHKARSRLRAVAGMTLHAHRTLGSSDAAVVLNEHNVENWTLRVNAHRTETWRYLARQALRSVGEAVNPEGWSYRPVQVSRPSQSRPYSLSEEFAFRRIAARQGHSTRAERLWVVTALLGAGLRGPEAALIHVVDVIDLGEERLGIKVRGRHQRIVPVRREYTATARAAIEAANGPKFVTLTTPSRISRVAARIKLDGRPMLLSRARATWLRAHLHAGTSLEVLRAIAGPLSAARLDDLLRDPLEVLDPLSAAMRGLGP